MKRQWLLHSPAACTPRGHCLGPSRHHRWCPRSPGQGSPLSQSSDHFRPPGGSVCCLRREKWGTRGWEGFSVLWDPHLSSRGCCPLRLQTLLVQTRSHCTGAAAGLFFYTSGKRIIRLKNRKKIKQEILS